jgi:hypothetical protein
LEKYENGWPGWSMEGETICAGKQEANEAARARRPS